ncbi:MAG TPA: hypothetical protein VK835_04830 [Bacteroidia bacterium]|jgi:hypothetical protein|nr:hypothetical protein [Bacteroidia bacterium]
MYNTLNIINQDNQYQVCKLFQNRVRHLSNYLVKIVGVNHLEKKHQLSKKIKEGKKPGRSMKAAVYSHMLRKMKNKLNAKNISYENTASV